MLIFLIDVNEKSEKILDPVEGVLLDYRKTFPKIKAFKLVPWYELWKSPLECAANLLQVASEDPVCLAMLNIATKQTVADHSIIGSPRYEFADKTIQQAYLKLLRNWLSPLSGNVGRKTVDAHDRLIAEQYRNVWKGHALDFNQMEKVSKDVFFQGHSNAGRRDRAQLYRNVTEAARALIGEVTCWASRKAEKAIAYRLVRSPGLAHCQRLMLAAIVKNNVKLKTENWEYLPYFLYGKAGDRVKAAVSDPLVFGALHDALSDGKDTMGLANPRFIEDFKQYDNGKMYARWRALPAVIRYQTLVSDMARQAGNGKIESGHFRVQFLEKFLKTLPKTEGISTWPTEITQHETANPHEPDSKKFPHASGWIRNEFCPNVVTSRLLLAPLYAGTSGHTQGRILGWKALNLKGLEKVPIELAIPAGYIALWRLYYDKRVSGFHTPFETLQGAFCVEPTKNGVSLYEGDDAWNDILEFMPNKKLCDMWVKWMNLLCKKGPARIALLDQFLVEERAATLEAIKPCMLPRWSREDNPTKTGAEVAEWSYQWLELKSQKASLKALEAFPLESVLKSGDIKNLSELSELAANTPLPKEDLW